LENVKIRFKKIHKLNPYEEIITNEEKMLFPKIRINSNIENLDNDMIEEKILELLNKFEFNLIDIIIEVNLWSKYFEFNDQNLIISNIYIKTKNMNFDVTAESRHFNPSFYKALYKLENQILTKRLSNDAAINTKDINIKLGENNKIISNKIIERKLLTNRASSEVQA
jgi:hypothetical protein